MYNLSKKDITASSNGTDNTRKIKLGLDLNKTGICAIYDANTILPNAVKFFFQMFGMMFLVKLLFLYMLSP